MLMHRVLAISLVALVSASCGPKHNKRSKLHFEADLKSGPDGKRSGAQTLRPNRPRTDEVSYQSQDRSDWYIIQLRGRPGVLATQIHWDNEASDIMIDVFDEFGAQIAASPVRNKGAKAKKLLTQIDQAGTYYIRVTAPGQTDGSVYTMEARWDGAGETEVATGEDPPLPPPPSRPRRPRPEPHEPAEPRERPTGETIQGHVVSAYREGSSLTLHIDKGSTAGIRVGMSGAVLNGPSGEDPLPGGSFRVTQVLDENKSLAKTPLRSIGRNTRVLITLSR